MLIGDLIHPSSDIRVRIAIAAVAVVAQMLVVILAQALIFVLARSLGAEACGSLFSAMALSLPVVWWVVWRMPNKIKEIKLGVAFMFLPWRVSQIYVVCNFSSRSVELPYIPPRHTSFAPH